MARIDLAERLDATRVRMGDDSMVDTGDGPLFARLTRKEARVREDQLADLARLSKRLMRARQVKRERITDNTLIRVAIDLLLAQHGTLCGSTESELLDSVTARLPRSDGGS